MIPYVPDVNVYLNDLKRLRDDEAEPVAYRTWARHILHRFSKGYYTRAVFLEVAREVDYL